MHLRRRDRYRHGGPWAKSHGRARRFVVIPLLVVVALLAVLVAAWAIDTKVHTDQVARGVTLDERSVSGLDPARLKDEVAAVARSWDSVPVKVNTPKGALDTNLGELGVSLDANAAADQAMRTSDDFVLARPFLWVKSFFSPRQVPLTFKLDEAKATARLADIEATNKTDPTEPAFAPAADKVSVAMTPGKNGEAIDQAAIVKQALDGANAGQRSLTIDAKVIVQPPKVSDADGQKFVDQANQMTKKSVSIYLEGKSLKLDSKTLLSWLKIAPAAGTNGLDIQIDNDKVIKEVPKLLGVSGVPVQQVSMGLGFDGKPVIVDGKPGTKCCTPESVAKIPEALKSGEARVDLQMAVAAPDHDHAWAEGLKIDTRVADFTTPHPCCEPRVTNIHKIADTVRGVIIPPGETFSLNGFVGQRTKEKGYVEAPVIYDGSHDTDVGGGVSQFATTLFNAAFFAGLDIPAYQMHSLYISRYPYGREATVSWDKPDLKIKNTTPFGIMIWTSYTDTSLTVAMYSTPWVKGDQTNQVKDPKGPCTKVTTERTRTYFIDNHTEVDRFNGLYQPADGIKC